MIKILSLFFILSFLLPSEANAEECNINSKIFGSSYAQLEDKYFGNNKTTMPDIIKGKFSGDKLCRSLEGYFIELTFFEKDLAKVIISGKSDSPKLIELIEDNYGKINDRPRQLSDLRTSFAGHTKKNDIFASYKINPLSDEMFKEQAAINITEVERRMLKYLAVIEDQTQ